MVYYSHCGKTVWQFPKKLNTVLPYGPTTALLGIHPRELKTYVHTQSCVWLFITILFVTAKRWKQSNCLSADEWINKMWCVHTMEYYSGIKRKKLIHAATLMILENMLSERSWTPKAMCHESIYMECSE